MSHATSDLAPDADSAATRSKLDLEISKLFAETSKLNAEVSKISAETSRINREATLFLWLPIATAFIGSTGMIGAIVALVVAFHK